MRRQIALNILTMHNTMNIFLVISCEKDQQVIVYCLPRDCTNRSSCFHTGNSVAFR